MCDEDETANLQFNDDDKKGTVSLGCTSILAGLRSCVMQPLCRCPTRMTPLTGCDKWRRAKAWQPLSLCVCCTGWGTSLIWVCSG